MKYIKRMVEEKVLEATKSNPVVALLGPRQSGKTTLAKHLFPDYLYLNLEFPDNRLAAEKDPRTFLTQAKKIIIDEAQRVPDLFSYIQGFVDEDKSRKYILTGSSNFLLMSGISQSLAGRVALFTILPFSKQEILDGGLKIDSLPELIWQGGYPKIWTNENNPIDWYKSYIQTYLEKDIRSIHSINLIDKFFVFLRHVAIRVGQELNLTDIAKEVGVSPNTISDWITLLEESYIIFKLRPYYKNTTKSLVKSPKIFFYDCGLVCSLLNFTGHGNIKSSDYFGRIFENFVISEIYKKNILENNEYTYYREYSGAEVDLLVSSLGQDVLMEIKSNTVYNNRDAEKLSNIATNILSDKKKLEIVYAGDITFNDNKVKVVSWKDL